MRISLVLAISFVAFVMLILLTYQAGYDANPSAENAKKIGALDYP